MRKNKKDAETGQISCFNKKTPSQHQGLRPCETAGLNVLIENRRNRRRQFPQFRPQSRKNEISMIYPMQKCVLHDRFVKFENFVHGEWREEQFSKGNVGDNMGLSF